MSDAIEPGDEIPVKLGDRVVGYGEVDADGFLHVYFTEDDVIELLNEGIHPHTSLSVSEDQSHAVLDWNDE